MPKPCRIATDAYVLVGNERVNKVANMSRTIFRDPSGAVLLVVGASALPMVPLVILVTPADELVRAVLKMLL